MTYLWRKPCQRATRRWSTTSKPSLRKIRTLNSRLIWTMKLVSMWAATWVLHFHNTTWFSSSRFIVISETLSWSCMMWTSLPMAWAPWNASDSQREPLKHFPWMIFRICPSLWCRTRSENIIWASQTFSRKFTLRFTDLICFKLSSSTTSSRTCQHSTQICSDSAAPPSTWPNTYGPPQSNHKK